jgi:hypothetical protein
MCQVGPGAVVLADLDHRDVERPQARADVAHRGEQPVSPEK